MPYWWVRSFDFPRLQIAIFIIITLALLGSFAPADDCKLKRGSFDESRMCVERDDCRKRPVSGACCIGGRCTVMLEDDCAKQLGRFTANQPCTGKSCIALEPATPTVKPSKGCSTGDGLGGTLSVLGILALAMMRRRRDENEARL